MMIISNITPLSIDEVHRLRRIAICVNSASQILRLIDTVYSLYNRVQVKTKKEVLECNIDNPMPLKEVFEMKEHLSKLDTIVGMYNYLRLIVTIEKITCDLIDLEMQDDIQVKDVG